MADFTSTHSKADPMSETVTHAELMDSTYKFQRLIYDATRRYYLLGRDHLVEELKPPVEIWRRLEKPIRIVGFMVSISRARC